MIPTVTRANGGVDVEHERADRARGRRVAAPTLALGQDPGGATLPFDPAEVWRRWAPDLRTGVLDAGHFLPAERPVEALRELLVS